MDLIMVFRRHHPATSTHVCAPRSPGEFSLAKHAQNDYTLHTHTSALDKTVRQKIVRNSSVKRSKKVHETCLAVRGPYLAPKRAWQGKEQNMSKIKPPSRCRLHVAHE